MRAWMPMPQGALASGAVVLLLYVCALLLALGHAPAPPPRGVREREKWNTKVRAGNFTFKVRYKKPEEATWLFYDRCTVSWAGGDFPAN